MTHVPHTRWCKWRVPARMSSFTNWTLPPFPREVPLLVMDYCFLTHADDEVFPATLVGRVYPSRATCARPCSAKGPDPCATRRIAAFLRPYGIISFRFMSDQEWGNTYHGRQGCASHQRPGRVGGSRPRVLCGVGIAEQWKGRARRAGPGGPSEDTVGGSLKLELSTCSSPMLQFPRG